MRFRVLSVDHARQLPLLFLMASLCLIHRPRPARAFEALVPQERIAASDSAEVVATAEKFHAALAAGDSVSVLALLAPDIALAVPTASITHAGPTFAPEVPPPRA